MTKKLFLMRHSEATSYASNDYKRELTEFGKSLVKKKAIILSEFLEKKNLKLEHCFYSSAKRTSQTFDILIKSMDIKIENNKTRALYLSGIKELKNILKSYKKEIETKENLLIIGHNFGISDIASILSGKNIYMDVGDIVVLEIDVKQTWQDLLDFEGSWDIIS